MTDSSTIAARLTIATDDDPAADGTILFTSDENSIHHSHKKQAAARKIAVLQVISRSGRDGNQYPLADGASCMIGSGEDCHVRFLLENVDTEHAQLVVTDGKITLKNLSAGEYTYINDVRMLFEEIRTIHFGDVVTISGRHMRIDAPIREPNVRRVASTPTDRTQHPAAAIVPTSLQKWSSNRGNNPLHSSTPNPFASQPRMSSWLADESRKSRALIDFDDTEASAEDMFATTGEPSPAIVQRHLLDATITPMRIKPSFFGASMQQSTRKQQHEKRMEQIASQDMDAPERDAEIEPLIEGLTTNVTVDATTANTDEKQFAPEQGIETELPVEESTADVTADVTTANTDEKQIANESTDAPEQDIETEPPMEESMAVNVTADVTTADTDEKQIANEGTDAPEQDIETEPPMEESMAVNVTADVAADVTTANTDEKQIANESTDAPEQDIETEPPMEESTADVTTADTDEKPNRSQRRRYVRPASAEPTSCGRVLRSHTKKATDFANQTTDKIVQKSKPKRGLSLAPPIEQTDPVVVNKRPLRSSRNK